MAFFQDPPRLENTWEGDPLLREVLARQLGGTLADVEEELSHLGALAAGPLLELQLAERHAEPRHVPFDAWGRRVDRIELTPLWREAARLAVEHGLVATAYERRFGPASRLVQFALVHVVEPSLDVYSCPLAMTDGAARAIIDACAAGSAGDAAAGGSAADVCASGAARDACAGGAAALAARVVPRLTSRDPARAWTSGQWMTERTGGSDVGRSETVARRDADGWALHGTKWFSSAASAEMALALARPEGNPPGAKGLALFHVETRRGDGLMNGITVLRLKEKLGTRALPTAEILLDGARATPVAGLDGGVKRVAGMLEVTRLWNAVCSAAGMQRAIALARDYARRRQVAGGSLLARPLHADTLAGLEAEREGALLLAFRAAALLGLREGNEAGDAERLLLRAVVALAKLTTGKQAVAAASEALECFGGAGYVEDTGLPRLLRDAQVLPIWEGTTNVLALESLRALSTEGAPEALLAEVGRAARAARDPALRPPAEAALRAAEHALTWLRCSPSQAAAREAGARRCALSLGRALEAALLCDHAQWCLDAGKGGRAAAAARRLALHGLDLLTEDHPLDDVRELAGGG